MATNESQEEIDVLDDDDNDLSREDLDQLRQRLMDERAGVKARLDRHMVEAYEDSDNLPDEMDIASRQSDQAYLLRLADKEKKLLEEIDHAIAKFERGVYGLCEGTGEPIGRRRLILRPWTRYSLEFKEQQERAKGRNRDL